MTDGTTTLDPRPAELGHVVLYVRDLGPSTAFYETVVGLRRVGTIFGGRAALFTGGRTHHELLLIEVGAAPGPLQGRRLGLYHIGFKVGQDLRDLEATRARLAHANIAIDGSADHTVSQSLYVRDPDGNEVELFVDDPHYDWRSRDDWMEAPVKPLKME